MTPDDLRRFGLGSADPARLLAEAERKSDAAPRDRTLAARVLEVHAYATAEEGIAPVVASVRRESLVRWDATSVTFHGTDVHSGRPTRVRVLRGTCAGDPTLRRALLRDGRSLRDAIGAPVMAHDGHLVALTCAVDGTPLARIPDPDDDAPRAPALTRMLGTAIEALARAESAGIGFPLLSGDELLDANGSAVIACLTPGELRRDGAQIARVAEIVDSWWNDGPETPVDAVIAGMSAFPPSTASDALAWFRAALRERLVGHRHELVARHGRIGHELNRECLVELVTRLSHTLAPPAGRGRVGVDLEGQPSMLDGDGSRLVWDGAEVYGVDLDVRAVRRLLRLRAAAPAASPDPFVDGACRFLASSLSLRTVRLLLEASGRSEATR